MAPIRGCMNCLQNPSIGTPNASYLHLACRGSATAQLGGVVLVERDLKSESQLSRQERGLTVLEVLILMAVLALLFAIAATNLFPALRAQGATAAAARGVNVDLLRTGDVFVLTNVESGAVLKRFELPSMVTTNWPENQALRFTPPGRIQADTLTQLPSPITVSAGGRTTRLTVSLIGEVRAQ
jgi:type II secretory pathway pseudopilin PulG